MALDLSTKTQNRAIPYQLFMLGLCVYVLLAMAVDAVFKLDAESRRVLEYTDTGICIIFIVDFVVQFVRADSKLRYMKWGWIDLVSSIPMVGPLRLGRAARITRIFRILRGVRSIRRILAAVIERRAQSAFLAVALASIVLLVFSSVLVLQLETFPDSNIKTAGDAIWWSFVTITTVGYGDVFPVSFGGRIVAAILMTAGVGLFGALSGLLASWFMEGRDENQDGEIAGLKSELKEIRALLEKQFAQKSEEGVDKPL